VSTFFSWTKILLIKCTKIDFFFLNLSEFLCLL
jgi:hypothetical protein